MFCMPRALPNSESPEASRMCGKRKRAHWKYECEQFPRQVVPVLFPFPAGHLPCRHTCTTDTLPISSEHQSLPPKMVSKSVQMDKDQDLQRNTWSRSMHLSNKPFCLGGHQWLGLRTGREGQAVLRDTMSICLPQSRINSDIIIPDRSLTCL